MTFEQEDAFYDFLDDRLSPFTAEDAAEAVRAVSREGSRHLPDEITSFLHSRRLAFLRPDGKWTSRHACFRNSRFVIQPGRVEIQNGILIPGHRCIPFANPVLAPHEYLFFHQGKQLPAGTTEAAPEELYPYYDLFGPEYSPQYIAQDNEENEAAYNEDPYDDPAEVSIHTLDMRALYRELQFVPGDSFIVSVRNWKTGEFELEHLSKGAWKRADLNDWIEAAKQGFAMSFDEIGPAQSTEEQIAFAYWFGGERMRTVPAIPLENFSDEVPDFLDSVPFGMESRLWYAGKEIPSEGPWSEAPFIPDMTEMEAILDQAGIPASEFVLESYVRDMLFRRETDIYVLLDRVVPPSIRMGVPEKLYLLQFLKESFEDLSQGYTIFRDRDMGPLRQQLAELHTAIIEYTASLRLRGQTEKALPQHSIIMLNQLQTHAAYMLEDLNFDDPPEPTRLDSMRNSLEAMIDNFEDLREAINVSFDSARKTSIRVVRGLEKAEGNKTIQVALANTAVWRRLLVPESLTLKDLHRCIQAAFGWSGQRLHDFVVDGKIYSPPNRGEGENEELVTLGEIVTGGCREFVYDYDYAAEWELRISLLHGGDQEGTGMRAPACLAGEGASPPEHSGGPLRFRRLVSALKNGTPAERERARKDLGEQFDPDAFDLKALNAVLADLFPDGKGA